MTSKTMVIEPDLLSDVMETAPLQIRFAGRIEMTAPWGFTVTPRSAVLVAVREGQCWSAASDNGQATQLGPGDTILLSPSCRCEIRDTATSSTLPIERLMDNAQASSNKVLTLGGGGSKTTFLGGIFQFDTAVVHPLSNLLPSVILIKTSDPDEVHSLEGIARLIDDEMITDASGVRGIIDRLIEVLLIQTVRVGFAKTAKRYNGSLEGILHPDLSPALALIHRHPEKPWTVAQLAEEATMSRSAFSAAFAEVLGQPPLRYLRERRMELACRLLRNRALGLKKISSNVGYESVSAFSAAFKRFSGLSPGDYRRDKAPSDARQQRVR